MPIFAGNIELDFAPLADFPELEILDIHDNYSFELSSVFNVDALYQLKNLQRLIVRLAFPLDFSKFSSVNWLQYKHSPQFKNVNLAQKLERLWILDYKNDDLEALAGLENLSELFLIQPTIASLSGIQGINTLDRLTVRNGHKLVNIDCLSQLPNLSVLKLIECERLTQFSCLIPSLEELAITNITNPDFLQFVPNLKVLTFDQLSEEVIAAILSSDLKVVNFPKSKISDIKI